MVRKYVQSKRAEAAEMTRRRIVEAVSALHDEQGIAATSMRHIAERAGVGIGTVYHHFPTYDDAIAACGAHMLANDPPPDASVLRGLRTSAARLARLCDVMFAYYQRNPAVEAVRAEQHVSPVLQDFLGQEERTRRDLVAVALADEPAHAQRLLYALLDIGVWRALTRAGFSTSEAAATVTQVVLRALLDGASTRPSV